MPDDRIGERADGTCPTCEGDAEVFPSPRDNDRGHIYCQEDECGMVHRDRSNVSRFIDGDSGA